MEGKKNELSPWRRAYGVTEFAQLYFPGQTPVIAYKRMWEWIRTSRGLKAKLEAAGWVKFQKLYTPKQRNASRNATNRKQIHRRNNTKCSIHL